MSSTSDRAQNVFKKAATVVLALAASSTLTLASAQQAHADGDISAPPRPVVQASTALDKTGNSIPKTNYPIPAGAVFAAPNGNDANPGTEASPVKSINQAVKLASDGGTIVMRQGQFRDWYHDPNNKGKWGIVTKALTFQAYPGESPWFNGSDIVPASSWTQDSSGTSWSMPWSTPQFCDGQYYSRPLNAQLKSPNAGPCAHFDMTDASNPVAGDPQMLFSDATPLKQVASKADLSAKTFYYDWNDRRLYIGATPSGRTIEAAVRPMAMVISNKGAGFRIRGIGFHRYANNEYHNMTNSVLYVGGSKTVIEDSVFAYNAAGGPGYSNPLPGTEIRRSVFAYNGYTAVAANGGSQKGVRNDFVLDGSVFFRNNTENFGMSCTISCGQAAVKLAHMVGATLSNNVVEATGGSAGGLWCDLDCSEGKIVNNTIKGNPGAGIFYEVSRNGIIAGNVVTGGTYGISVASATTKVYNNTLVDNTQGINVYDDDRSRGRDGWNDVGPDTRDVEVVNNVVSGRNYSLRASSMRVNPAAPNTGLDDFFKAVDHNVYHQTNGAAPIFVWLRAKDGTQFSYRTTAALYADRKLDRSSRYLTGSADPLFVDKAAGDYRLRADSAAHQAAQELPADVAEAMGSAAANAGSSSGAPVMAR
jgi:parallel beta-helix repeat protein